MPWPSHNSTVITSGTAEVVESFKRLQNIMDGKLNTTYKHCQRKLFVAGKLKVLSVAVRRLLFGVCPPFILLHRSICCFNGLTVSSSQTCTDSDITRLSTLTDVKWAAEPSAPCGARPRPPRWPTRHSASIRLQVETAAPVPELSEELCTTDISYYISPCCRFMRTNVLLSNILQIILLYCFLDVACESINFIYMF